MRRENSPADLRRLDRHHLIELKLRRRAVNVIAVNNFYCVSVLVSSLYCKLLLPSLRHGRVELLPTV